MPFNSFPGQIYSQSVQRETLNAGLQQLEGVLACLSERDRSFAQSLISQGLERGSLSEKQHYWVGELTSRGLKAHAAQLAALPTTTPAANPGNPAHAVTFSKLAELFARAGQRAVVMLRTSGKQDFRLSVAGERSSNPGSINVTDTSTSFESRVWFGRITPEGGWVPSRRTNPHQQQAVEAALAEFNADPAAAAAAYGHAVGSCCFCSRLLTDERSVSVGYGPICADRFGLPWGEVPGKLSCQEVNAVQRQVVSEADIPF